jgi:polyisoprenoid-binding protein YceI
MIGVTLTPAALSAPEKWQSDSAGSKLLFAASFQGLPINGAFNQFTVDYITDDNSQPQSLEVTVSIASADMGNDEINQAILTADWFNPGDYQQGIFSSASFKKLAVNQFVATGTLQLKGVEKTIAVPFNWRAIDQSTATLSGELVLERDDFAIGIGEWASGDRIGLAVRVWFDVVLSH